MRFFREYQKQILLGLSIILVISAIFTVGKKTNATFFEDTLGFVVLPVQKGVTNATQWVKEKTTSKKSLTTLEEENKALQEKVAYLEAKIKRISLYETENVKLSKLLKMAQRFPEFETQGTQIIGKNPGNWYHTFIIDKGTRDGLTPDMVLTSPEGLVGKITESGYTYSKGQSILDSRSSVSAMSLRTGELGVVKGDYSLMNNGLCRMEYINAEAKIMEGDEIVTSHLSDIYPPGIAIGKVKEIKMESNGLTKYAIIEPFTNFKNLETLLVITKEFQQTTETTPETTE